MKTPEQPELEEVAEKWLEKESVRVSVLTDLQTLIKEIISSRDTYWKERVRAERDRIRAIVQDESCRGTMFGSKFEDIIYRIDTPIINEDNLK